MDHPRHAPTRHRLRRRTTLDPRKSADQTHPTRLNDETAHRPIEGDYLERTILLRTLFDRLGHAHELTTGLIFLASDASSYITEITLPVEGGMLTS